MSRGIRDDVLPLTIWAFYDVRMRNFYFFCGDCESITLTVTTCAMFGEFFNFSHRVESTSLLVLLLSFSEATWYVRDAEISQCLRTHFMTNVTSLSIVDDSWKLEEWEIPSEKLACCDVGWYRSLLGKRSTARGWNEEVVDIRYWKVRCFFNQHRISIPFLLSSIS